MKALFTINFLAIVIFQMGSLCAQMNHPGTGALLVGFSTSSTGNGHGTFWSPSMGVRAGRREVFMSVMVQKSTAEPEGLRLTYSQNLTGPKLTNVHYARLQLNFASILQYIAPAPLCPSTISEEKLCARGPGEDVDWSKIKVSTVELGIGIEFRVNISSQLYWRNFVLASPFYHPKYFELMEQSRTGMTIALGTGINFCFTGSFKKASLRGVL